VNAWNLRVIAGRVVAAIEYKPACTADDVHGKYDT